MRLYRRLGAALVVCGAAIVLWPSQASAQAKDAFVEGLIDLSRAAAGVSGAEGPALAASIDRMAAGLEQWDAAVSRVEAGFAGAIGGAAPPEAAQMHATLGVTLLERGRTVEALQHLDAAARLSPALVPIHLLRGAARGRAGAWPQAADAYRAARAADPARLEAAYLLAHALRDEAHLDGARVQNRQQAIDALVSAALERSGSDAPATALFSLDLLDDASVEAPLFLPGAYDEGLTLLRQARYGDAVRRLRAAAAGDPLVTDPALGTPAARAAAAALGRGDAAAALAQFAAVEGAAGSAEVQRLLGLAALATGDRARALDAVRRAGQLQPANERARLALADVLVETGDAPAALQVLADCVHDFPASGLAAWKRGVLQQQLGDQTGALTSFVQAAQHPPLAAAWRVHAAIGRQHQAQFNLPEAVAAFERSVELAPGHAPAHVELGEAYRAGDRLDLARAEFAWAVLLAPRHVAALAALGQLLAGNGRDAEALPLLRRAVTLEPEHREARYALSRALLRLGQADEGREQLRIFQALQAAAMERERERYQENLRQIEGALRSGEARGTPP